MFKEVVFFPPACEQPVGEDLVVVSGDVFDGETTPVHVNRLGRPTFKVGGAKGEEVLAILTTA